MKKITTCLLCNGKMWRLSLLFVCLCFVAHAQNRATLISENFDGTTMPTGWTIYDLGVENWTISGTSNAGGNNNELLLYYSPAFNGTSRMVMPAVDLTGVEKVGISFKHALDNYSGSHLLGVATTSNGGTTWNSGWSKTYGSNGQFYVNELIETADIGNSNVMFCIYYTGNSYNINNWYFDDIEIFTVEDEDASVDAISCNEIYEAGDITVPFVIASKGTNTINSVEVSYQFTGHEIVTETFSDLNIQSLQSKNLVFTAPQTLTPGAYTLTVWISKINGNDDLFTDNNSKSMTVSVATQTTQRTVLIEHFSSSSCGPCVSVNNAMHSFFSNAELAGKYCYVKYPMNWPGTGDPYYTAEGGVRRAYYGVNAVPQIQWEGNKSNASPNITLFNELYQDNAYIDITGDFSVNGNNVTLNFSILPYITVQSGVKVHVAICERTTTGNPGGNGESSFHHIMMKMVPNAQGVDTALVAGQVQNYSYTIDMSQTNVEQMDDLEVAIFVQKHSSKYIYNSTYLETSTCHRPKNFSVTTNIVDAYDMTAELEWDAPLPFGGDAVTSYRIYGNGELLSTQEGTSYTYSDLTFGETCFTVESNCADAVGQGFPNCVTITCPTPTTLAASVEGESVNLTWKGSSLNTEYKVYRTGELIATVTDTSYTDEAVTPGAYAYKVMSVCDEFDGSYSNTVNVKVGCLPPTDVTLTVTGEDIIRIAWTASATATSYNVYCADTIIAEGITNKVFNHKNLRAGTHCYTVKSVCANGVLSEATEQLCETLTGIEDLVASTSIYPNPANTMVQIDGNNIQRVSVFDVLGRMVDSRTFDSASSCVVETSNYQKGIYLFNIEFSDGRILTHRVAIAH